MLLARPLSPVLRQTIVQLAIRAQYEQEQLDSALPPDTASLQSDFHRSIFTATILEHLRKTTGYSERRVWRTLLGRTKPTLMGGLVLLNPVSFDRIFGDSGTPRQYYRPSTHSKQAVDWLPVPARGRVYGLARSSNITLPATHRVRLIYVCSMHLLIACFGK